MINIYQQVYKSILQNNNYRFSINNIENAFMHPDIISDTELRSNIINQTKFLFTLSDNFINYIFSCQNGTMLTKDILLSEFQDNEQIYNKIKSAKSQYPMFIYKVNFTIKEISQIIAEFCIDNDPNGIKQIAKTFIQMNKALAGAVISLSDNVKILLFNNSKLTNQVIIHEFYHYFQDITKHGFSNRLDSQVEIFMNNQKVKNIFKKYNLNQSTFYYLFNRTEFLPHVNDLCHILMNVYLTFYTSSITKSEFLDYFLKNFLFNPNQTYTQKLIDQYSQLSNDACLELYMLKMAYELNFKYNIILKHLTNIFSD